MDAWQKTNVEVFTGLNSGVSPELIKDGEARDILNFHMEKVGKLVTRDGSACVLFTLPAISARSAGITGAGELRADPVLCYSNNKGIIGIGEITLAEKWIAMDTDRFMVYVVRGAENSSYEHDPTQREGTGLSETQRDIECYLFAPITGRYKNKLMTNYNWVPSGTVPPPIGITSKRTALPQDMNTASLTQQLYAPNREIPELYDSNHTIRYNADDDDHWIKQFVDMHQYRHQLIISDRINGDMLIEDEATREKIEQCDDPDHALLLRPNTLDVFNVDSVILDGRFQENEENDATDESVGVTNGMALYNYELPEKEIMVTQDYAPHKLDDYEYICKGNPDDEVVAWDKIKRYVQQYEMNDFLTIINIKWDSIYEYLFDDGVRYGLYLNHNEKKKYLFSNENTPGSFFDILGELKLPDDEYIDEDGKKVTEFSSNAYIWEDHPLIYYPSRGSELTNILPQSDYLLREIDNVFQKFTKDVPRITKLEPIENAGKYAPLGVWRYRFVWDYGGGVYSAPSAEMLCPDIMWSALRDDEVYLDGETTYARPQKLNGYELEDDYSFINDIIGYQWIFSIRQSRIYKVPPLFLYGVGTTKFGELIYDIKTDLYSLQHRYGPQYATLAEVQAYPTSVEEYHTIGKLGCMATVFFSSSSLKLNGTIWEGAGISFNKGWNDPTGHIKYTKRIVCSAGGLIVPIFQGLERHTYESVFDDEGRLRLAYQMTEDPIGAAKSKNYLVAPGANIGFGDYLPDDTDIKVWDEILFANQGESPQTISDLYYNLITVPLDQNNNPTIELLCMRADTIVRGVKQEKDRLTDVKTDIDPEALARLILQGTCELHLCKNGEDVYVQTVDDGDVYTGASDRDEHVNRSWDAHNLLRENLYSLYYDVATSSWIKIPLSVITNLDIYIYGTGERLTAAEQLTAYFPSALLFGAPRMGLKIQNNDVPARAKRLLIFRTKSTHSNDYHPLNYGLVDIVEIQRSDGTVIDPDTSLAIPDGEAYTEVEDTTGTVQNVYRGIYYFDKIKDTKLDFGDKPENYDGLTKALKSRFNIPLNERVYYLNFEEEYQPLRPRLSEYNYNDTILLRANTIDNTNIHVYPSTDDTGYDVYVKVKYKYIYIDVNDVRSEVNVGLYEEIEVDGSVEEPKVVVLAFIPSQYDATIDRVEIYRSKMKDDVWGSYYKIGEMEEGTQGVFVDNDLKNLNELGCTLPQIYNYESGMRWSEPYRPDWIKAENFTEYRSGDGDQITGVQSNYGNLVIFKETSVHREAVQAEEIPLSRRDEVTPDTGAIAPNAIISINNTIYFLSWEGLKTFDNNQVVNIDQPFNEELMLILERAKHAGETVIRDASCGYNPYYNELYTNIPALPTILVDDSRMREYGQHLQHYHYRTLLGHIYVINLDGYATKYGNTATLLDENYSENGQLLIHETTDTRQNLRKYYTNSLGEMRSADIFPQIWASLYDINTLNRDGFLWGGVYIETPYDLLGDGRLLRDYDLLLNARWYDENMDRTADTLAEVINDPIIGYQYMTNIFPMTLPVPILARYKSKFYTGDEETLIKRIRKCNINIYSRGMITIKAIVIPYQDYDERIDNVSLPLADQTFVFNPSQSNTQPFNNNTLVGTKHGILSIVPRTPYGPPLPDDLFIEDVFNDRYAKPVRISIEIESSYRTQLNAIALHWRGIQKYLM